MLRSQVSDNHGVLAAWVDAPQTLDSASSEHEALWFAVHTLSLRVDGAAGGGIFERPFVRRLVSSSSRILSVRSWKPSGGSYMVLSCIVHYITVELSDGLMHVFEVQRKSHGLALTSHTLRSAASPLGRSARERENPHVRSKETRIMSFNIWNYNGNWLARARMIADVIEASGAGAGVLRGGVVWRVLLACFFLCMNFDSRALRNMHAEYWLQMLSLCKKSEGNGIGTGGGSS